MGGCFACVLLRTMQTSHLARRGLITEALLADLWNTLLDVATDIVYKIGGLHYGPFSSLATMGLQAAAGFKNK